MTEKQARMIMILRLAAKLGRDHYSLFGLYPYPPKKDNYKIMLEMEYKEIDESILEGGENATK